MNSGAQSDLPRLSLIIAVYNKPEILRFVLEACKRQLFRDFEVILADDGSGPQVRGVADEYQAAFPLVHLWHEDRGWRKNTIMNQAIREAKSDYLVFIDGDCIPSGNFLLDHWSEREAGRVLLGRRMETSKRWSNSLSLERIRSGEFERIGWREFGESLRGEFFRFEDGIRIPSKLLRQLLLRHVEGMLGCNFSASKKDLEAVNGFDEMYDGPGCGEDSDLQYRLSLIGVRGKSLRNLAIQFHVHHPATKTSQSSWDRFHTVVKPQQKARCEFGLVKNTS